MKQHPPQVQAALDAYYRAKSAFLQDPTNPATLPAKRMALQNIYQAQREAYSKPKPAKRPRGRPQGMPLDVIGKTFGHWLVLHHLPRHRRNRRVFAQCGRCGTKKGVFLYSLVKGTSKSCCNGKT